MFLMSLSNILITAIIVIAAAAYVLGYIGLTIYRIVKKVPHKCSCGCGGSVKSMKRNVKKELDKDKKCKCCK